MAATTPTRSVPALGGVPLVCRVAEALLGAGVRDVVVVTGHRAAEVAHALQGLAVRAVHHGGYAAGQVSSLRAGLAALSPGLDAVSVALADQPLLEASDVRALLDAFEGRGAARVVVPRVDGQRGHPVVFDSFVCDAILRAGRTTVHASGCRTTRGRSRGSTATGRAT